MFFFPFKDDNPTKNKPFISYLIIFLCCIIFMFQFSLSPQVGYSIIKTFGATPYLLTNEIFQYWYYILSSMFLHGSLMHLVGNLIYLWIFGDNIEDEFGRFNFIIFYILCGIGAVIAQILLDPQSNVTMIGASGAIAGVLGAYMIKFPTARLHVAAIIVIFVTTFIVPAQIVLGIWFIMQLSGGLSSLGIDTTGGVAWFSHIGGFVIGIISLKLFQTFHLN